MPLAAERRTTRWVQASAAQDSPGTFDRNAHLQRREMSGSLAGANPHLSKDAVCGLLAAHGGHHASRIMQIMAGNMKAESATRGAMEAHTTTIADALVQAIAKQFPKKAGWYEPPAPARLRPAGGTAPPAAASIASPDQVRH